MDDRRFDELARSATQGRANRRGTLLVLAGAMIGGLSARFLELAGARRRKKRRKKKLVRNAFGCVAIGGKCRGNDSNCCSGVCQGKKPKQGKKDKSICVAHNVGDCAIERDICATGDATESACGESAVCAATTGQAAFCASQEAVACRICRTDQDCERQGFPLGSACILLTGGECVDDGDCNGVSGSQGTACAGPGA